MSKKPTEVQAKVLAMAWSGARHPRIASFTDPTTKACLRRGWFKTSGVAGFYPSGKPYERAHITDEGIRVLGMYLIGLCHARPPAPESKDRE